MLNFLQQISVVHQIQLCPAYQAPRTLFLMVTVCGLSLSLGVADALRASDDSDALYHVVVEGIRENSQKLKCATLVWQKTEKRKSGSTYPEREGTYRLWWDGEKIATKSNEDSISGSQTEGWQKEAERRISYYTVYDGKEFRRIADVDKPTSIGLLNKPDYRVDENWFEHVLWPGHGKSIIEDLNTCKTRKDILCTWYVAEMNESKLIKLVTKNTSMNKGTYGVWYFDPSKGFNLVCRESYFDDKMEIRKTVELNQVSGGAWFPVETNVRILDPNDGTTAVHRTMKVDLEESSFNESSMIPAGVFHIDITNDMTVHDHRAGVYFRYKKDMTPLAMEGLEEAALDFMTESPPSAPIEPTKAEQVGIETNAKPTPVQTETWDDLPEPLLQTTPDRRSRSIAQPIAMAIGMGLIILGAAGWYLRKRPSTPKHTDSDSHAAQRLGQETHQQ